MQRGGRAGAQPVIVALVSEEQFFLYGERGFSIQRDSVVDDPLSEFRSRRRFQSYECLTREEDIFFASSMRKDRLT